MDDFGVGSQLPYVPAHRAQFKLTYSKSDWTFSTSINHTAKRYTTLDNTEFLSVSGYSLVDLAASRDFTINQFRFNSFFKLNNLLDSEYENYKNYAMPGINYTIGLIIDINFKTHED